jgi:hypothetical protein
VSIAISTKMRTMSELKMSRVDFFKDSSMIKFLSYSLTRNLVARCKYLITWSTLYIRSRWAIVIAVFLIDATLNILAWDIIMFINLILSSTFRSVSLSFDLILFTIVVDLIREWVFFIFEECDNVNALREVNVVEFEFEIESLWVWSFFWSFLTF